jgi:YD repeat-containing protein
VNPLGATLGTRSYAYDENTLKVTGITDENGWTTNLAYSDLLDRLTEVRRAAGTATESDTVYAYYPPAQVGSCSTPVTPASCVSSKQDQVNTGDGAIRNDTIYDGLGRAVQANQYETTSGYISSTTLYDALGRTQVTSNPARAGETPGTTTYSYDALGRTTQVLTSEQSVTNISYTAAAGNSAERTTITDPAGNARRYTTDALGRLTQVEEDPNNSDLATTYQYDVLDDLKQVTQGAQTRSFTYDS